MRTKCDSDGSSTLSSIAQSLVLWASGCEALSVSLSEYAVSVLPANFSVLVSAAAMKSALFQRMPSVVEIKQDQVFQ